MAVSTGLGLSSALLAGEPMSEPVNMKELPAAVQKTITEKAAGRHDRPVGAGRR